MLACLLIAVLAVGALIWVLFLPPPDRALPARPFVASDPDAAVRAEQIAQHNAVVDMVTTLRCAYCREPRFVSEGQLIDHVLAKHGEARANQVTRAFADAWHRRAGIQ